MDPLSDQPILVPPSGHVAGVSGLVRRTHGESTERLPMRRCSAPAASRSRSATRSRSISTVPASTRSERPPRAGFAFGARALSSDPEWRYVNLRRSFIYIAESIEKRTRWAVFEPNDKELWSQLRARSRPFLLARGSKEPSAAPLRGGLHVKCDEETNARHRVRPGGGRGRGRSAETRRVRGLRDPPIHGGSVEADLRDAGPKPDGRRR